MLSFKGLKKKIADGWWILLGVALREERSRSECQISEMSRFASAQEAKEFLIEQIVLQAKRDEASLTDVERKMLYFTETYWTLPDIYEVNNEFESEYDLDEYEQKIAGIIRNAVKQVRKEGRESIASWLEAIRILNKEDHYLMLMMDAAGAERGLR